MTSVDEDYATSQRLAMYLEAGWSDFLFEMDSAQVNEKSLSPNPLRDWVKPDFFRAAATLAHSWASDASTYARSVCDIGGGTGRAIFELERRFPRLQRLVLVEPSRRFCEWAQLLLASDNNLPEIPVVNSVGNPQWISPRGRPPPIRRAAQRLTIRNGTLEGYKPEGGFDLVTCLNVIDRHPNPMQLVPRIGELMNDNGLLLLSSPFDFSETFTPNVECWIDDLNTLFQGVGSWEHVGEDQLFYEFRLFNRKWTRYCSQIVGKRWRAT